VGPVSPKIHSVVAIGEAIIIALKITFLRWVPNESLIEEASTRNFEHST